MVLIKNKKQARQFLFLGIFIGAIFLSLGAFADPVIAQQQSLGSTSGDAAAAAAGIANGDNIQENDGLLLTAFKWLLYGLLIILVKLVQVAASIFAWATRPEYISGPTGLLNLESVYTLWKFIRDFFNLFFIFLLLFAAFATVFQIEQFGIKKNFLKIIIAAIVINFSFPLTRIIIDLGNVPMYFFADAIVSSTAGEGNALMSIPNALWRNSQMGDLLTLPNPSDNGTLVPLITAIIFTFIFMITLITLALLFVVRLLKLIILLILSPVGLAASIVPGLAKYGKDWWSQLIQTVLFGPAAMLLIVIALRFTAEISQGSGFITDAAATAPASNAQSQSSIISQGVFFIPIILMWMAMGVGAKFGIEGSKTVIGKAKGVAAWGKKQALFRKGSVTRWAASPVTSRVGGAYKGAKKGLYEGKLLGKDWSGGKVGKYLTPEQYKQRGEAVEARYKGFVTDGRAGVKKEEDKLRDQRAREQEKKWKEENKSPSQLLKEFEDSNNYEKDGSPKYKALAAANMLASEKEFTDNPEELKRALLVASRAGKKDLYEKLLQNADDDALELKVEDMKTLINQEVEARVKFKNDPKKTADENRADFEREVEKQREKVTDKFKSRMKKGGNLSYFVDYQVENLRAEGEVEASDEEAMKEIRMKVYNDQKILNISAKDMAKQGKILADPTFQEMAMKRWTPKQLNGVEKFVIEDGKPEQTLPHIETIRRGLGNNNAVGSSGDEVSSSESPRQQRDQKKRERDERAREARENKTMPK